MINRSIKTLTTVPQYQVMKDEMIRVLDEMESEGKPFIEFPPELAKLGTALSLTMSGPTETIYGLMALLSQLAATYPDEFKQSKLLHRTNNEHGCN